MAELQAEGRENEAIAIARHAASAGNVDALALIATWHMVGKPLPRDLGLARAALRRAVEIGHVDAALMEVALTANGSGGPRDWPHALTLLETAAKADPVAAEHMALIRAMNLNTDGAPRVMPASTPVSEIPLARYFPSFCSPAECAHLAQAAHDLLAPAVVVDPNSGRHIQHPVRTSFGAVIGPTRESLVVQAINAQLGALPLIIGAARPDERRPILT